jgi:hypothetical protein
MILKIANNFRNARKEIKVQKQHPKEIQKPDIEQRYSSMSD